MPSGNQCQNCAHFYGVTGCEAYPAGIPEKYLLGEAVHDTEQPDQVPGFVYEYVAPGQRQPLTLSF